jgi:hypothetical protein
MHERMSLPPERIQTISHKTSQQTAMSEVAAALTTTLLASNVVITRFVGRITSTLAEQSMYQFSDALAMTDEPRWIMELSTMTGFDPSAVSAGAAWWRTFKRERGREILLASTHGAARMAGASLAFSVGLKVKTFDDLRQCLVYLGLAPAAS